MKVTGLWKKRDIIKANKVFPEDCVHINKDTTEEFKKGSEQKYDR